MNWAEAVAKAVADGKTDAQFAIPDGKYVGDLFFITDAENRIIIAFAWTGDRWMHEHEVMDVEVEAREDGVPSPAGLKPVSVTMHIRDTNS